MTAELPPSPAPPACQTALMISLLFVNKAGLGVDRRLQGCRPLGLFQPVRDHPDGQPVVWLL